MPDVHVLVAGVSARAFAESAALAGFEVTALDAFGDLDRHPGVRALSLPRDFGVAFGADAVAAVAETIACDAIVYLSPFENHPDVVERLSRHALRCGNGASVLRRVRDPRALEATLAGHSDGRWLVKPLASGGGHGIRWWKPGDAVPRGAHVQPFVDGTAGSIVFVAANGEVVPLGITRQLIGDQAFGATGFRYCGSILSLATDSAFDPDGRLAERAIGLAGSFAREFGLVGVNCIDFVARDGVPVPIEVNPRYSASMELVERTYGVSVFGAHAAACVSGELPAFDLTRASREHACDGKAIVFARDDVVCGDTTGWLTDAAVRDVPHPNERIPAGRPVCTVFAGGPSADACHAALAHRACAIYDLLDSWASVPA